MFLRVFIPTFHHSCVPSFLSFRSTLLHYPRLIYSSITPSSLYNMFLHPIIHVHMINFNVSKQQSNFAQVDTLRAMSTIALGLASDMYNALG